MNHEPRIKTPKEIAQDFRDLLEKDGGSIISINIFENVLILKAHLWSLPQLERFLKVGKEMKLILNGKIEKEKLVLVLSASVNRNGVSNAHL